ncbi:hypothetical protein OEZ85_003560 [Tetradesmus obliquus]|uniref:BTB domain-containing protein n=1 Tax=Tetradesmus obliquus TaxID=3088 RepID=A0ABY8UEW3_TETOB|nr:hypothetical protein OEZ85_003560 [Tetradesmus obliquus]
MDSFSTLQQTMGTKADIDLVFDKDGTQDTLMSHSSILQLSSQVLAHALELHSASSSSSSSSSTLRQLPLPGTSKADFLTVAQFLYPIAPLPKVSWDNLEVLLVEGRKWDMQVVLAHVAEFLQANASSLDLSPTSPHYAFKWLQLADAAGLSDACKACADRIVALDRSSCVSSNTQGLSPQTPTYLLDKCATSAPLYTNGCLGSSSSTAFYGTAAAASAYFGAGQDIYGIGVAAGGGGGTYPACLGCYSCAPIRAGGRYTPGGVRLVRTCHECGREV